MFVLCVCVCVKTLLAHNLFVFICIWFVQNLLVIINKEHRCDIKFLLEKALLGARVLQFHLSIYLERKLLVLTVCHKITKHKLVFI